MQKRKLELEVKELRESGEFEGYVAVTGNQDKYDDVIDPGAFKKTNAENDTFPLLWQHDPKQPIGVLKNIEEDQHGEYVEGDLNLETQKGREAYSLLKQGAIKGLSIGYKTIKDVIEDGIRRIKELKLMEGSIVTFPANPQATIQSVKTVTSLQDIPLAPRDREWSNETAEGRVREWAGGPDKEDMDWQKYRRAFMWYNSDEPELFGSYKLPYGDIIDGKLYAVPRGIFAVAGVLQGSRGGVNVPDSDVPALKSRVESWYARMRDKFDDFDRKAPWLEQSGLAPSLLQTLGAVVYYKDNELSEGEAKLIDEVTGQLTALQEKSEPSSDTQDGSEDATPDQEPSSDTLEEIASEFKEITESQ